MGLQDVLDVQDWELQKLVAELGKEECCAVSAIRFDFIVPTDAEEFTICEIRGRLCGWDNLRAVSGRTRQVLSRCGRSFSDIVASSTRTCILLKMCRSYAAESITSDTVIVRVLKYCNYSH